MRSERGTRAIRIANCSGFFGDRLSAAQEMVDGGPIDVLTGDWLAELTMLILHKQRSRNPDLGYAGTFLTQMEQVLGTCVDRGIAVVTNAGGLNPAGCAEQVRSIAARLGLTVRVAHVEGDDLMTRIDELRPGLDHLDTGRPLTADPVSANAYLGGWGIARALRDGADVVVCPRVTDASLVVGPAAWWWDWALDDWDRLAGAVVAGHVIECGAQTTGGNYSWFDDISNRALPPGFPIAEIGVNGDTVITKHPGTGGLVNVATVTSQLLYEIGSPRYLNPDVTTDFTTIHLESHGADRVQISSTRGSAPPPTTKVCININGGYRNRMSFVLSGLDQAAKAEWATDALFARLGGRDRFDEVDVRFVESPSSAPGQEASSGVVHVVVKSADEHLVGRAFSSAAVELALANYPGFFTSSPPGGAQPFGVYWPALVPNDEINQVVVDDRGVRTAISRTTPSRDDVGHDAETVPDTAQGPADEHGQMEPPVGPALGEALGAHFAARSGDKGGNANVGVFARDQAGYRWLEQHLTVHAFQRLIPESRDLEVHRYELANLNALNFVVVGMLGDGVASSTAFDPQAKGLGEYLRSRIWS
jgi:hypothetical protein